MSDLQKTYLGRGGWFDATLIILDMDFEFPSPFLKLYFNLITQYFSSGSCDAGIKVCPVLSQ